MTGTNIPYALNGYRSHSISNLPGIGGRVEVELDDGRTVLGETWPPDGWDDPEQVDWFERTTITFDERDARELLSPDDYEELRAWMVDLLDAAGALTVGPRILE